MKNTFTSKTAGVPIILLCLLLLLQTPLSGAEDEITGLWEVRMDFDGREMFADLVLTRQPDGSLSGMWGSDELSDVKFQDDKLTFTRTLGEGDRQFTSDFEATLTDGKLKGTMTSDWGRTSLVCVRPEPMCPALGKWDMSISLGDRDINAVMTISKDPNGKLEGKWTKEPGEHTISDINYRNGRLTFNRHVKLTEPEMEFETPFEGTIESNKLSGTMKNEMGQWQVTGHRIGKELVGRWELTTTSQRGTRTHILTIYPDLSGRYEMFGSQVPVENIELEGDQVSFGVEMGPSDRTFRMDFKGTLKDESLEGQFTTPRDESSVTGEKISSKTIPDVP